MEFFLVRIFLFRLSTGKYGPEKLRIWALFTQCLFELGSSYGTSFSWFFCFYPISGEQNAVQFPFSFFFLSPFCQCFWTDRQKCFYKRFIIDYPGSENVPFWDCNIFCCLYFSNQLNFISDNSNVKHSCFWFLIKYFFVLCNCCYDNPNRPFFPPFS